MMTRDFIAKHQPVDLLNDGMVHLPGSDANHLSSHLSAALAQLPAGLHGLKVKIRGLYELDIFHHYPVVGNRHCNGIRSAYSKPQEVCEVTTQVFTIVDDTTLDCNLQPK
jgi:hypothetical protein